MNREDFYKSVLNGVHEGVYFVDENRKITFWNKGAENITGYAAEEIMGKHCYDNILDHVNSQGHHLCSNGCPLQGTIHDGKEREIDVYLRHKNGYRVPVRVYSIPIIDNGKTIGAVETFIDKSSKNIIIESDSDLIRQAYMDQLTELPNRRYFEKKYKEAISHFTDLNLKFGVVYFDIDHFRNFNNTYGHDVGDLVLQMVAKVFTNSIRNKDIICRYGGEEFVGVFCNANDSMIYNVADRIRILIENSILTNNEEDLHVTISAGATLIKKDDTIDTVLKRADEALYEAKETGRNKTVVHI